MKLSKLLLTMGVIILLNVLINEKSSANEINSIVDKNEEFQTFKVELTSTSVIGSTTVRASSVKQLPYRVWHTKGDYGGYIPLVNTRFDQGSFIGTYRGYLYKNVAPHSNSHLEEY